MRSSGSSSGYQQCKASAKWIEYTFTKRECARFVPSKKQPNRCACGQSLICHKFESEIVDDSYVWLPSRDTRPSVTDSYGTIDFVGGGPHPNKAHFIRLGFDSRPDTIVQLLTRQWSLELPKLVISVHGGKANFELPLRLKRSLCDGLLRAAKTTGAWILTSGTNCGVTRHVGDALVTERSPRLLNRGSYSSSAGRSRAAGGGGTAPGGRWIRPGGYYHHHHHLQQQQQQQRRVVSIGIAPWGVVENRATLVGPDKDATYLSIDQPRPRFAALNNRLSCFLLADNGTVGKLLRPTFTYYMIRLQLFVFNSYQAVTELKLVSAVNWRNSFRGSDYRRGHRVSSRLFVSSSKAE